MSREAKPYPQVLWEGFTEGEPGQCGYAGLSDWCRQRCDRGAEAVIAAYEEDRRRDAGAALSAVEAQLRQVWKLVSAMLGVTGTAGCDPMEDEGAFLADAASLDSDLMEGA